jgi:hypothetical protein
MNAEKRLRSVLIGGSRDLLFHKVSLIAVLAWVGLGADGLSSSCYGPEEIIKTLGNVALAPIVAFAAMLTIAVICISYSQIIELFQRRCSSEVSSSFRAKRG